MFSKEKITLEFTEEKCNQCNKTHKRKFKIGDHLFKELSKCDSCDGSMMIAKIYGETMEK